MCDLSRHSFSDGGSAWLPKSTRQPGDSVRRARRLKRRRGQLFGNSRNTQRKIKSARMPEKETCRRRTGSGTGFAMDREKDVVDGAERVYPLRYTPRVRRPRTFAKFAKNNSYRQYPAKETRRHRKNTGDGFAMDREKDVVDGAERVYPLRYTPRVRRPRTFARRAKISQYFSGGVSKKRSRLSAACQNSRRAAWFPT